MKCKSCGHPDFEWCPGCRTVSRIGWLWGTVLKAPHFGAGLQALRECAGVLTDLAESSNSFERAPAVGGSPAGAPGSGHQVPAAEEKEEEEDKEKVATPPKEEKPSKEAKSPKVETRSPPPSGGPSSGVHPELDEDSFTEEESEEEETEKDPVVEKAKEPEVDRYQRYKELKGHKFQKGNLVKPLGLTSLGVTLSAPSPETVAPGGRGDGGHRGELPDTGREGEREALPRRNSSSAGGHRRPISPEGPPRGEPSGRDRSRSRRKDKKKKKKHKYSSKGKKKRDRGKEFQQRRLAEEQDQWRRKRRHDW